MVRSHLTQEIKTANSALEICARIVYVCSLFFVGVCECVCEIEISNEIGFRKRAKF